jgi:hypothetical protein
MPTSARSAQKSASAKAEHKRKIADKAHGNGALIAEQDRQNYVEVAAYYIAEHHGFQRGSELEDWLQAEQEVNRLL